MRQIPRQIASGHPELRLFGDGDGGVGDVLDAEADRGGAGFRRAGIGPDAGGAAADLAARHGDRFVVVEADALDAGDADAEGPGLVAGVHDLQAVDVLDGAVVGFARQRAPILEHIDFQRDARRQRPRGGGR